MPQNALFGKENVKQKYHIQTFGCQMNSADTERMQALLNEAGHTPALSEADASLIIINGCSVREKAVHKAVSSLGRFKERKKSASAPLIGVGGCVGQLSKTVLFQQAPHLDFVFGTDCIDQLPEIVYRAQNGEKHILATEFDPSLSYSTQTKRVQEKVTAFVNIMKGCDKYCTYCIVPFTRGKEKSRLIDEVLADIRGLVRSGVKEVTLLGQNVNSFGKGNANLHQRKPFVLNNVIGKVGPQEGNENFPMLLYALDQDPECQDLKRIRFTSSHPLDFSDQLIECYANVGKLAKHLHLPVQSGSDRVLKKMGRHHSIEAYLTQMRRLREICPDVGITTDLIVGFPTETKEDFEATLQLLDVMEFDQIYAFAYSVRPGTRAALIPETLSEQEKKERLNVLLAHQRAISLRKNQKKVGKIFEVLVEGMSKGQQLIKDGKEGIVWTGRTSCNGLVNFVGPSIRNFTDQFVQVKVVSASSTAFQGEIVV